MKEIILTGKEYEKLCSLKKVTKNAILYNENDEMLVFEEENDKSLKLPSILTSDENVFYKELSILVNIPISKENTKPFLKFIDIHFRFEHKNNRLKKCYTKMLREYYYCFLDLDNSSKISSLNYFNGMSYLKFMPIEEVIERSYLRKSNSHTGDALCEFQKIKKR